MMATLVLAQQWRSSAYHIWQHLPDDGLSCSLVITTRRPGGQEPRGLIWGVIILGSLVYLCILEENVFQVPVADRNTRLIRESYLGYS